MPRRARLDAPPEPCTILMVRGVENGRIVNNVADHRDFVKPPGDQSAANNTRKKIGVKSSLVINYCQIVSDSDRQNLWHEHGA